MRSAGSLDGVVGNALPTGVRVGEGDVKCIYEKVREHATPESMVPYASR